MHEFSLLLKSRRNLFGLSQGALAQASKISLPTIQNLEAGKGNPSLLILEPLLAALGLKLEVGHCSANWDLLADLGAPILSHSLGARPKRNASPGAPALLLHQLRLAALEIRESNKQDPEIERKKESVQAVLLAIKLHYPPFFENHFQKLPLLTELIPTEITGRLIKLKRQALARLSEYL